MAPSDAKASVRATNVRVMLGVKDSLIDDGSGILTNAAENVLRLAESGQSRWKQAIRARRANWMLIPQQLPAHLLRKDSDVSPKDFLLSYALDDCKDLVY